MTPPKVRRVKAVFTLIQFALYAFEIKNTFNTNSLYVPKVFDICITPNNVAMLVKTQNKGCVYILVVKDAIASLQIYKSFYNLNV